MAAALQEELEVFLARLRRVDDEGRVTRREADRSEAGYVVMATNGAETTGVLQQGFNLILACAV